MRQQPEVLEDHADPVPPQVPQTCGEAAHTSSPAIEISPAVGSISRVRQRTRVDLPLPDRPITTNTSPGRTEKLTSLTAATHPVLARSAAGSSAASGLPRTRSAR
nr:hypothetical protein GCM10020093_099310 [Planobispora longispora]